MLTDPRIRAVVPPRGGKTAIDLLPLLDWASVAAADPTWSVGIAGVGCGHVPPYVPMVNGALGHLRFGTGPATLTQSLR